MLIKLFYKNRESGWLKHSGKQHRDLLLNPPEKVEIQIGDFYINSPEKCKSQIIEFKIFNIMARDFFLSKKAEEKRDERNLDVITDVEELECDIDIVQILIKKEENAQLNSGINKLTETQKERIKMYYFDGLTFEQIANLQNVHKTSVKESINIAVEKLKKYFI